VNHDQTWRGWERSGEKGLIINDNQAQTWLIITINDTSTGDLPLIITISDTCKNQPKRLDFDNSINLSSLIVSLDAKWMVLNDKFKKRTLFKIRVDLWYRLYNLPEDRATRAGLGAARRDRLEHTYTFFQHTWSDPANTERHYRDWLRSRRARGQPRRALYRV
jgi:hypothetical protein